MLKYLLQSGLAWFPPFNVKHLFSEAIVYFFWVDFRYTVIIRRNYLASLMPVNCHCSDVGKKFLYVFRLCPFGVANEAPRKTI